jgi:hypothetical protein
LTENRTQYPPFASTTSTWPSRSSSTLRPDLDPASSSSQGYHLLITHATERIPSNMAKGAAAAVESGRKHRLRVVNRIGTCSLADRRPTACDLNWRPLYAFFALAAALCFRSERSAGNRLVEFKQVLPNWWPLYASIHGHFILNK